MKHSWPQTIRIIVFSCLIGGAAGVLGTALTTDYLSTYALQLGELVQPRSLTQERPRALPKDYEDALARLEERALPAVGLQYSPSALGSTGASVFASQLPVTALTSDGWALASQGRIGDTLVWGGRACEVDRVMVEPRFGFSFVHCASVSVPVVDIQSGYDVSAGDQLFVVASDRELVFTQARAVVWGEMLRASDLPSRRVLLAADVQAPVGSPVFNVFGELVGVVGSEGSEVVVFEHLTGAFEQALSSPSRIVYPSLGVMAIDLSRAVGVSQDISRGLHAGAALYGARAVGRGSAAQIAGLREGDILLSVEGVAVDGQYALDDLIALYAPGDQIRVEVDRAGARQEVMVTLGEREN